MYPVVKQAGPSLSTQDISNGKLQKVLWEVCYDTVNPNHTSPSPTDTLHLCKCPVGIHSDQSRNLDLGGRVNEFQRVSVT